MSIIISVLNDIQRLIKTYNTLDPQLMNDFEVIYVDGGSTDGTLEYINKIIRLQDHLILGPDKNPTDANNKGLAKSSGRYIFFLSAGDLLLPNALLNLCKTIKDGEADFIYGPVIETNGAKSWVRRSSESAFNNINVRMNINTSSILFSRKCFEIIGAFNERFHVACDFEFMMRMKLAGLRGTYYSAPQIIFPIGGLSAAMWKKKMKEFWMILSILHPKLSNRIIIFTIYMFIPEVVSQIRMKIGLIKRCFRHLFHIKEYNG